MKSHLKRIPSPKSWPIERKGSTFLMRPKPGKNLFYSITINLALKTLEYANTSKEVKSILNNQEVLIDGKRVKDQRKLVGLMDVLSFPLIKKAYRLLMTNKGFLEFREVNAKESNKKPCKIVNKTLIKSGKLQLGTFDSRCIVVEKDNNYSVGDSVVIELPSQKIIDTLKLEVGNIVYLTKGNYMGEVGKVKNIEDEKIFVESNGKVFQTLKSYAYVIGKDKSIISLFD